MTVLDLFSILPILALVIWALFLLLADLWISKSKPGLTPILAVFGLLLSLGLSIYAADKPGDGFGGMIRLDGFATFLHVLFTTTGAISIVLAYDYLRRLDIQRGEFYPLIMLSVSGMMLMGAAGDLVIVFLALEFLSIPLYIMAAMDHHRIESREASLKYFLLGTFASAFVLFGIALLFGATKTTNIEGIRLAVYTGQFNTYLLIAGSTLLLAGFGFKVSAVPFHEWTPDVYQGSPSPVTAFMAVCAKAAGFAALIRVFSMDFIFLSEALTPVFWILAVLTMVVGNVAAVIQKNLKRLLAYSSIAHAGYIIMAFVSFGNPTVNTNSVASALFYLAAYAFTSMTAWAVIIAVEHADGSGNNVDDLAGLGKRAPLLAAAMTVAMLSFTGIPLTLGFWGKFYLFRTAIEGGFIGLAVIGLVTSLVSAYYYLRVIVKMYFHDGEVEVPGSHWIIGIAVIAALIVVGLAFIPGMLFGFASGGLISGL